jgi:hypothetical protein
MYAIAEWAPAGAGPLACSAAGPAPTDQVGVTASAANRRPSGERSTVARQTPPRAWTGSGDAAWP